MVKENVFLKKISGSEAIIISAVDGTQTITEAGKVFRSWIDNDFENWNTNKPGVTTKEQMVEVHETANNVTFRKMFGSFETDLDNLVLTQHQIIDFCTKYPNWLHEDGYGTIFLFKIDTRFFAAIVGVNSGGLFVGAFRFERGRVWSAGDLRRVVVPKQIP